MSFLHTDMTLVVDNPFPCKTRTYLIYLVNIMGAEVLAMQGARAICNMDTYYAELY